AQRHQPSRNAVTPDTRMHLRKPRKQILEYRLRRCIKLGKIKAGRANHRHSPLLYIDGRIEIPLYVDFPVCQSVWTFSGGFRMSSQPGQSIDMDKLNAFMQRAVGDMGAAMHAVLITLGDRLGLFKAMADSNPVTPAELAKRTGTHERYVREWLNANAASGYVSYDAQKGTYTLPPEQAFALAVENSPAYLPG